MTDLSLLPLTELQRRSVPAPVENLPKRGTAIFAMRPNLVLAALLLAACSTAPATLPRPDGQVFRLNPDRWPETVNDIPAFPARTAAR
jgi:hypothetical protein